MENSTPDARLQVNARRYAETYLRNYRRMLETRLREVDLDMQSVEKYSPLVAGQFEKDFSLHVAFEPFATWMIFSTTLPGQFITGGEDQFNEDRELLVSHEEKKRQVLKLLGLSDNTVLAADRFSRPAFLRAAREDQIDRYATTYAIVQAQADVERIRHWVYEQKRQREWETAAQGIRIVMDSPGTQESGIRFQTELTQALEIAGCAPRDVRITGQQIDASCWISDSPVLIEMLNSTNPADAAEVRDIGGKLQTRPASVIGVLCAPNGFTGGAMREAERLANTRTILLWGRAEIEEFIEIT